MRVKICRKEIKESIYWLKLVDISNEDMEDKRNELINEATQMMKIFGSIVTKVR